MNLHQTFDAMVPVSCSRFLSVCHAYYTDKNSDKRESKTRDATMFSSL